MADANVMTAEARDRAGKGAARATRRAGRVPAVIYGGKQDPVLISVDPLHIVNELESGALFATVYEIEVGGSTERVLPRDVQFHPVTDTAEHVDFLRVTDETRVTVDVPCNFVNQVESPGLKRGGVLNVVRHAIEMHCQVDNIPQSIEIDLTGLEINDGVHISDVTLPEGVELTITDRDFTIATVAAPTVVAEETTAEQEGEEEELLYDEDGNLIEPEEGEEGEEGAEEGEEGEEGEATADDDKEEKKSEK